MSVAAQMLPWEFEKWCTSKLDSGPDNTSAHRSVTQATFFMKHNVPLLPHPSYLPELAPCDFCLLTQLKENNNESHYFDEVGEIQTLVIRKMRTIAKNAYQRCFCHWQEWWNKNIWSQGHNLVYCLLRTIIRYQDFYVSAIVYLSWGRTCSPASHPGEILQWCRTLLHWWELQGTTFKKITSQ